ncbi:MAG: VCBS repeat-containing protein [Planctomycetes bacterium]|nr:VCBS repeat-containing protein [Planctomycetota bacterium]
MRPSTKLFYLISVIAAAAAAPARAQLCPDRSYSTGVQLGRMAVADINRDGAPDFLVGSASGVPGFLNSSANNGFFTSLNTNIVAGSTYQMVAGDFNHDGIADIVCGNGSNPIILISFGTPAGGYLLPAGYSCTFAVDGIAAADLNRDGNLDIVTINSAASMAVVLLGTAAGGFLAPVGYSTGAFTNPLAVAIDDFNMDGSPDVVTANSFSITYFPGNVGVLGAPQFPAGATSLTGVATGDINHDGYPDAVFSANTGGITYVFGGGPSGLAYLSFANVGVNGSGVMLADFNQDGNADVAVTSADTIVLAWVPGSGNGTFGAFIQLNVNGLAPTGGAAADFNGDGRADVATSNKSSGTVSLFMGNVARSGQFNFLPSSAYGTGANAPFRIVAGDFARDGATDLFVYMTSGYAAMYANNGAGTMAQTSSNSLLWFATGVISGDFDNDGYLDVAQSASAPISGLIVSYTLLAGYVNVLTYVGGNNCTSLAAGDFNLDGKLDIAINDVNTIATHICINNGAYSGMSPAVALSNIATPIRVAVADVNEDGRPDVVVGTSGYNDIVVHLSTGTLTFAAPVNYALSYMPVGVAIDDANRDGKPDIITLAGPSSGIIGVMPGTGSGTFGPLKVSTVTNASLQQLAIADFNTDGKNDLALAGACGSTPIVLGNGQGGYIVGPTIPSNCNMIGVAAADFNRDGRPDFATIEYLAGGPLRVFLSSGSTTNRDWFSMANNLPAPSELIYTMAADLDHDGQSDLVTVDFDTSSLTPRLNNSGCFAPGAPVSVDPLPRPAAIGDVDLDGIPDLVSPSQANNTISVRKGVGAGLYGPVANYTTDYGPLCAAIGDINQDGLPDVVTANFNGNSISLLMNFGGGIFAPNVDLPAGSQPDFVLLGNFDADGNLDIAVGLFGTANVLFYQSVGFGLYYSPVFYTLPAGSRCGGLDAGDLDQNGLLDMASANFSSSTVSTMINTGGGVFSLATLNAGVGPISVAITDLDADGFVDIASANNTSDDLSLFFGLGAGSFAAEQRHLAGRALRSVAVGDFNLDGRPDLALAAFAGRSVSVLTNAEPKPASFAYYGFGTSGCYGKIIMNANKDPKVNTPDFTFTCTHAPRNSLGIGLVANVSDPVGNDYFSLGVQMLLDFVNMTEFYYFNIYTDDWGTGIGPVGIPNDNTLIGKTYYVQGLFVEDFIDGEACSTSPLKVVTSRGLQLTIQP